MAITIRQLATEIDERALGQSHIAGDAGKIVQLLRELGRIKCHGPCLAYTSTEDIRGYPHESGVADENGIHWRIYVHCNNATGHTSPETCNYENMWFSKQCLGARWLQCLR